MFSHAHLDMGGDGWTQLRCRLIRMVLDWPAHG